MAQLLKRIVQAQVPNVLIEDLGPSGVFLRNAGDSRDLLGQYVSGKNRLKFTLEEVCNSLSLDNLIKRGHLKLYDENGNELNNSSGGEAEKATNLATLKDIDIAIETVNSFVELTDTPSDYIGYANYYLRINSSENSIEFADFNGSINSLIQDGTGISWTYVAAANTLTGNVGGLTVSEFFSANISQWTNDSGYISDITGESFVDLDDTPANYTSSVGYLVRVNSTPDGLEFVDGTTLFASSSIDLQGVTDNGNDTTNVILGPDGAVGAPSFSFLNATNYGMYYPGENELSFAVGGQEALNLVDTGTTSTSSLNSLNRIIVQGEDNTVSRPQYSFSSENTTGMYLLGSGQLDFAVSSTKVLELRPSSIIPFYAIQGPLQNASSPTFSFQNDSDTGMYRSGNNTLGFSCGGTLRASISSSGITLPSTSNITIDNSRISTFPNILSFDFNSVTADSPIIRFGRDTNTTTGTLTSVWMRADGTNTPSIVFNHKTSEAQFYFNDATAESNIDGILLLNFGNATSMTGTETSILFRQYYYDAITPAPVNSARFSVGTEQNWTSTATTQNAYMSFGVCYNGSITERVRISSEGNFGIAATSPTYLLDIDGSVEEQPNLVRMLDAFGSKVFEITGDVADTNNSSIKLGDIDGEDSETYLDIQVNNEVFVFNNARILTENGTLSLPSFSFINDPNTGMYRSTTDTIGFTCGGVLRASISNDGISIPANHSLFIDNGRISVTSNLMRFDIGASGSAIQYRFGSLSTASSSINSYWYKPGGGVGIQFNHDTPSMVMGTGGIIYLNAGFGLVSIRSGSGSPEGVVAAVIGSLYLRIAGGAGASLYVKEGGATGNTGWAAK